MNKKFTAEDRETQFLKYCYKFIENGHIWDEEDDTIVFLIGLIWDAQSDGKEDGFWAEKGSHYMGVFSWMRRLMKDNPGVSVDVIIDAAKSEQHTFEYLHQDRGFICALRPIRRKYDLVRKTWTTSIF